MRYIETGSNNERHRIKPEKKKSYVEFPGVTAFMNQQPEGVRIEYDLLVEKLEAEGRLSMPEAEKITGENLFVIRVIRAGNVRIFYVYGTDDFIYGIHAYVKKTRQIPKQEIALARKLAKALNDQEGMKR